ncbi:hypothetical protein VTK56DRAFT_3029 [Thermocarpiscus australiensis]
MVVINLGYTAPINRPGQTPILTLDQVWAGLQRKVRHADEFVPTIAGCDVLAEEKHDDDSGEEVVTRLTHFGGPGNGPLAGRTVKEVCRLYPPCRIDFHHADGPQVANFVTQGPSGEPHDLYMTYVFRWPHPKVEEGSGEAERLRAEYKEVAKRAVESSIETIRRMNS